jgi:hypothetical protein
MMSPSMLMTRSALLICWPVISEPGMCSRAWMKPVAGNCADLPELMVRSCCFSRKYAARLNASSISPEATLRNSARLSPALFTCPSLDGVASAMGDSPIFLS